MLIMLRVREARETPAEYLTIELLLSGEAESKLKGVALRIWPLNPTANGRNFNADLAKTVPAAETAKQGFSAVTRKNRLSKGTN